MPAKLGICALVALGITYSAAYAGQPADPGGFGNDGVAGFNHTNPPGALGGLRSETGGAQAPFGGNPSTNHDVKSFAGGDPTHGKP
jgi:hypothetical protein